MVGKEDILKLLDAHARGATVRRFRSARIERDQVHLCRKGTNQTRQPSSILRRVIFSPQQNVLQRDPTSRALGVRPPGLDDLGDRIPSVDRHKPAPKGIRSRVEGQSQADLHTLPGQPADTRHDPRGRKGDPPGADRGTHLQLHQTDGPQDVLIVEQRLTHTHQHDVPNLLALFLDAPADREQLINDLRGGEVPPEPHPPGGTEATSERTSDLRRETDGSAIPFLDQNTFHRQSALQFEEKLRGLPVPGGRPFSLDEVADARDTRQFRAERLGEIRHLIEPVDPLAVDPAEHLLRAVSLLPERRQEILKLLGKHTLEVYSRVLNFQFSISNWKFSIYTSPTHRITEPISGFRPLKTKQIPEPMQAEYILHPSGPCTFTR